MHVVVLGGGVIGITTAYYLARQGAKVTLVDRQDGPAKETSFANAGQVSPGYSTPWAAPGIPLKALKWMFQSHAPLAVRPDGSLHQLRWIAAMLRECAPDRYALNKGRMLRLAEYSRDCLRSLRDETGIEYDARTLGLMQLFRDPAQLHAARRDTRVLEAAGVPFELVSRERLVDIEPGLSRSLDKLAGGLRLPNDETGDCHVFTTRLAGLAAELGVTFRYGQSVDGMVVEGDRLSGVRLGNEVLQADQYVAAFGSYTRDFLRPLGLNLPVYPVKGYSLTLPLTDADAAPRSTVLDETYKVAVTRLGDQIRVGGMAELVGYDLSLNPRRRKTLERVLNDLYPGSGDLSRATFWTGLRPMTPDGTPIVGRTHYDNLFLNTGHGTLGWTMACGSSRLLADVMMGRTPDISTEGLDISRYGASHTSQAAQTKHSGSGRTSQAARTA